MDEKKQTPKVNSAIRSGFLSIVIDKKLKEDFTDLCKKNGLDFSYANAFFITQCLKIDNIPFERDQISINKTNKQKRELVRCSIRINPDERNAFKNLCMKKKIKMIDCLTMFMKTAVHSKKFPFSDR